MQASFGFATDLRRQSAGAASASLMLSHWERLQVGATQPLRTGWPQCQASWHSARCQSCTWPSLCLTRAQDVTLELNASWPAGAVDLLVSPPLLFPTGFPIAQLLACRWTPSLYRPQRRSAKSLGRRGRGWALATSPVRSSMRSGSARASALSARWVLPVRNKAIGEGEQEGAA